MKIKLICVGKTNIDFLKASEREYLLRLKHYITFEKIDIPDIKNTKNLKSKEIKIKEGELIKKHISNSDSVVLLDENGKQFSSVEFANFLQKRMNQGIKSLVFVIGGAYGFSDEIYALAESKLSLSKMTFSHQMIRSIFLEQLYRGMTILKGEPYHHA